MEKFFFSERVVAIVVYIHIYKYSFQAADGVHTNGQGEWGRRGDG